MQQVYRQFLACVAVINSLFLVLEFLPFELPHSFAIIAAYSFFLQFGVSILYAVDAAMAWQKKEKCGKVDATRKFAIRLLILRCWLAFLLSVYGFAKILGTQFGVSYVRNDRVLRELSGFDLTWNYFGYSYPFAFVIALFQIIGGVLLLWKRTTLLGVLMLLPVMLNIILINIFYSIAFGAFLNSVMITAGLLYLLTWYRTPLWHMLVVSTGALPSYINAKLGWILTVAVVGLGFTLIVLAIRRYPGSGLEGKWKIVEYVRNGKNLDHEADSTGWRWKNVYIEPYGMLYLSSTSQYFDEDKSIAGFYHYYPTKRSLRVALNGNNSDSVLIQVYHQLVDTMEWKMIYNKDTLRLTLAAVSR